MAAATGQVGEVRHSHVNKRLPPAARRVRMEKNVIRGWIPGGIGIRSRSAITWQRHDLDNELSSLTTPRW